MIYSKDYYNNISTTMNMKCVLSELVEIVQARDWDNFTEEISDFTCSFWGWIYTKCRINVPLFVGRRAYRKYERRILIWKEIFNENRLTFRTEYLKNGGNYLKEDKVRAALELGRKDQR